MYTRSTLCVGAGSVLAPGVNSTGVIASHRIRNNLWVPYILYNPSTCSLVCAHRHKVGVLAGEASVLASVVESANISL